MINHMDKAPPQVNDYATDDVTMYYDDGSTTLGYLDYWSGWMRWTAAGPPEEVADDDEQPVGWSAIGGKR